MREDPSKLFTDAAWYYARYRAPYPPKLFEDIKDRFHLDGKGALLDLGCGTGELVVPLSPLFEKAVGIDPSAEMLNEAKERIKRENASNVELMQKTAEEADPSWGKFRLTTIGTAFHWMEQVAVLNRVYEVVEEGGGLVIAFGPSSGWWNTSTPWRKRLKEIVQKYLGEERRAGAGVYRQYQEKFEQYEKVLGESSFKRMERHLYPFSTVRNADEVLGLTYSSSWAAKKYFGDKAPDFERELKAELLKINPQDEFVEEGNVTAFFLYK